MKFAVRVCCKFLVLTLLAFQSIALRGQPSNGFTKTAVPVFDVVSIRPSGPNNGSSDIDTNYGSLSATNTAIRTVMAEAFMIRGDLIVGVPVWADHDHFDIKAKCVDQDPSMLKS